MTDLTDKWKKGELLEDFYYVRCAWSDEVEIRYVHNGVDDWKEIVAEVPDYVEWKNMVNCACEEHEANKRFIEENVQLKEQINHLLKTQARQFVDNQKLQVKAEKAKDVVNFDTARQIKQLKELLKECQHILKEQNFYRNTPVETDTAYRTRCLKKQELLTKIDEVLNA